MKHAAIKRTHPARDVRPAGRTSGSDATREGTR